MAGALPALAETLATPQTPVASGSILFSLVRMLGGLALVFAFLGGGVWLFRNWQRLAGRKGPAAKLSVHEVKALGHRQALYVIGYERQRLLVASSPAGVTMLTALPAADNDIPENVIAPQPNFTDVLLQVLQRKS
jgi:flagellar biogenesis protein FliO